MARHYLLAPLIAFLAAASPLPAGERAHVDYDKIDRTIGRQPPYQSDKPEYGLLLFGPRARLKLWLVADGETLYLDRNGNGDLTDDGERFEKQADCEDVEIKDADGQTRYVITGMHVYREKDAATSVSVDIAIHGPLEYEQYCDLSLAAMSDKAAIAHFHGPLTIGPRTIAGKLPPDLALSPGEKPSILQAWVGTLSEKHGCWVVVRTHDGQQCRFADGVRPKVTVEFPAKAADAPSIRRQYALDEFC
jgi:hypothetical protein